MANIDIKYGFIVNLMSKLAIGEFDNKKGIFFFFYQQTSNLTLNFIFARNRLRDAAKIVAKVTSDQNDQNDRGTK
jgi:hypothetical protein